MTVCASPSVTLFTFSTLIDYHNQILDIVEENINSHGIGLLRNLINELTSKSISILQIAQDNTGVITLNDDACSWIEQLSRASLATDEYFLRLKHVQEFRFSLYSIVHHSFVSSLLSNNLSRYLANLSI